jgi:hypothetical protein
MSGKEDFLVFMVQYRATLKTTCAASDAMIPVDFFLTFFFFHH